MCIGTCAGSVKWDLEGICIFLGPFQIPSNRSHAGPNAHFFWDLCAGSTPFAPSRALKRIPSRSHPRHPALLNFQSALRWPHTCSHTPIGDSAGLTLAPTRPTVTLIDPKRDVHWDLLDDGICEGSEWDPRARPPQRKGGVPGAQIPKEMCIGT